MQRLMQLALDFLGRGGDRGADAGAMPPARRSPPTGTPRLRVSRPRKPPAPELLPDGGAGEADGVPGTLLAHPRANREALLGGQRVVYALERGRRRTIGFSVGPDGLCVRAPGWVPLHQIDAALLEKSAWILRKLAEAGDRRGRQRQAEIAWGDGARFPYLGREVKVALGGATPARGASGALLADDGVDGPVLRLALPHGSPPDAVAAAVQAWLRREARPWFTARLDHFAPRLGVQWRRLALTSARTRWGSASGDGGIRLHWRLMHFRPEVIDYVVVHELAHLRHMDHSPRFWATVATVVPDHPRLRAELRSDAVPRWSP